MMKVKRMLSFNREEIKAIYKKERKELINHQLEIIEKLILKNARMGEGRVILNYIPFEENILALLGAGFIVHRRRDEFEIVWA